MKKLLLSVFAFAAFYSANAQCNEIFFSEYIDGSGNDKALELYNPTASAINLSGYSIHRYSNGATTSTAGGVLNLSGTIAPYGVFVIVNGQTTTSGSSPAASPVLQAMADQLDGAYPAPTYMNGDDAITLEKGGLKLDIIGKIGEDPGASWTDEFPYNDAAGAYWTKDHTLERLPTIQQGVTTNPSVFNPTAEWDSLPKNTWTGLGSHECSCAPAGVNDIDNTISVVAYPNPSNGDLLNISAAKEIERVVISNMMGQVVMTTEGKKEKKMLLETLSLAKGMYVVKVMFDADKSTVFKISVQ